MTPFSHCPTEPPIPGSQIPLEGPEKTPLTPLNTSGPMLARTTTRSPLSQGRRGPGLPRQHVALPPNHDLSFIATKKEERSLFPIKLGGLVG